MADDFTTCINCGLCRFVCEDGVLPHVMGMWVRRSIGSSKELAKNNTLELDLQQIEFEWKYLLDGDSALRMKHAQQFRESGEIES